MPSPRDLAINDPDVCPIYTFALDTAAAAQLPAMLHLRWLRLAVEGAAMPALVPHLAALPRLTRLSLRVDMKRNEQASALDEPLVSTQLAKWMGGEVEAVTSALSTLTGQTSLLLSIASHIQYLRTCPPAPPPHWHA